MSPRLLSTLAVFAFASASASCASTLQEAARKGRTSAVQEFLQKGTNVNERNVDGFTALQLAVSWDHPETVRALLEAGADVNASHNGETALTHAALIKSEEIAKMLIDKGAKADAFNSIALTYAVIGTADKPASATLVRMLVAAGADPNARRDSGAPLILGAAQFGNAEVIRTLVELGAKTDWVSPGPGPFTGWDLVAFARLLKNTETAQALLDARAKTVSP